MKHLRIPPPPPPPPPPLPVIPQHHSILKTSARKSRTKSVVPPPPPPPPRPSSPLDGAHLSINNAESPISIGQEIIHSEKPMWKESNGINTFKDLVCVFDGLSSAGPEEVTVHKTEHSNECTASLKAVPSEIIVAEMENSEEPKFLPPADFQVSLTFIELTGIAMTSEKSRKGILPRGVCAAITICSKGLRDRTYIPSCPLQISRNSGILGLWSSAYTDCSAHFTFNSSHLETKNISLAISLFQNGQIYPFGVAALDLSEVSDFNGEKSLRVKCTSSSSKRSFLSVNKSRKNITQGLIAGADCLLRLRVDVKNQPLTLAENQEPLVKTNGTSSSMQNPQMMHFKNLTKVLPTTISEAAGTRDKTINVSVKEPTSMDNSMNNSMELETPELEYNLENCVLQEATDENVLTEHQSINSNEMPPLSPVQSPDLIPSTNNYNLAKIIHTSRRIRNNISPYHDACRYLYEGSKPENLPPLQHCLSEIDIVVKRGVRPQMRRVSDDVSTASSKESQELSPNKGGFLTGSYFFGERGIVTVTQAVDQFSEQCEALPVVNHLLSQINCERPKARPDEDFESLENEAVDELDETEFDALDQFEEKMGLNIFFESVEDALFGCHAGTKEHTEFFTKIDAKASKCTDMEYLACDGVDTNSVGSNSSSTSLIEEKSLQQ